MKPRNVLIFAILVLVSSVAAAGFTQPQVVDVDLDNMTAIGDMHTARLADNEVELIGCGIRVFDDGLGGEFSFGFCQATDADEEQVLCTTFSQYLVDAIATSSDFSFVTFSWDENDECRRVGFSTQSFYLPKTKK